MPQETSFRYETRKCSLVDSRRVLVYCAADFDQRIDQLSEPTQLNFDLAASPASRASVTVKKGRHWVWIPAFTGSRLPGHWVELDDSGSWAAEASSFNVVRVSPEELQRTIHSKDIPRGR
jgi:hypothetical protein